MPRRAWLTPDTLPTSTAWWAFLVPDDPDWRTRLWGAVFELTKSYNWEQDGSITPEDTADRWLEVFASKRKGVLVNVGEILLDASGDPLEDDRLECDGAAYDTADYPDLFDVIGYTYGGSGASFNVPDLRGRMPIGVGSGPGLTARALADTGGAEQHQLTVSELPAHTHSIHNHIPGIAQLGVGEAVSTPGIGSGSTGSTGGDAAHNNMPPFAALRFVIVTGK